MTVHHVQDGKTNLISCLFATGIQAPGAATDLSGSAMEKVLQVNVLGPFLCAREAMNQMMTTGGGRILQIGSLSATSPRPNSVAYTTSKFALEGLTKSLALEGRCHKIAVGIIHPGNVVSALLSKEEIALRSEEEGFLLPEDVARCVLTMANLPYSANVLEMTVLPTRQPFVGRG